jgi:hypothetical protein
MATLQLEDWEPSADEPIDAFDYTQPFSVFVEPLCEYDQHLQGRNHDHDHDLALLRPMAALQTWH